MKNYLPHYNHEIFCPCLKYNILYIVSFFKETNLDQTFLNRMEVKIIFNLDEH